MRPFLNLEAAPVYTEEVPALMDSDPASATQVFNPVFTAIMNNVKAVKQMLESQDFGEVAAGLEAKADRVELAKLTGDFAHVMFRLHLQDVANAEGMGFVVVQEFDTAGDLELVSGRFSEGRAFI